MMLSEIRIYEPLPAESSPLHQLNNLSFQIGDVAEVINAARDYVLEAKIPNDETDTLSGLLRSALSLLRNYGECFEAVEELSRGWKSVPVDAAVRQAA